MEGSMLKPRDTTLRTAKYVLSYMAKPLVVAFAPPAYVLHLGSSASPMFLGNPSPPNFLSASAAPRSACTSSANLVPSPGLPCLRPWPRSGVYSILSPANTAPCYGSFAPRHTMRGSTARE